MKNPLQLILLMPLLLFGCVNGDLYYKTLDFEEFTLQVPVDWDSFSSQGYDSKVGGVTNGKDKLVYDYGWYSYDFQHETTETHRRIAITIDGKPALMVLPIKKGKGIIGVYIEVDDQIKFNLLGRDIKDEDRIKLIFESVRFKEANDHIMLNPHINANEKY